MEIAEAVRHVVGRRHFPLVEGLAHAMALAILKLRGATWARVRVRKLTCLEGSGGAGVEVVAAESDSHLQGHRPDTSQGHPTRPGRTPPKNGQILSQKTLFSNSIWPHRGKMIWAIFIETTVRRGRSLSTFGPFGTSLAAIAVAISRPWPAATALEVSFGLAACGRVTHRFRSLSL